MLRSLQEALRRPRLPAGPPPAHGCLVQGIDPLPSRGSYSTPKAPFEMRLWENDFPSVEAARGERGARPGSHRTRWSCCRGPRASRARSVVCPLIQVDRPLAVPWELHPAAQAPGCSSWTVGCFPTKFLAISQPRAGSNWDVCKPGRPSLRKSPLICAASAVQYPCP